MAALLIGVTALASCANKFIPPDIDYDDGVLAKLVGDPPLPVRVVELPKPLPLPGQLKPLGTASRSPRRLIPPCASIRPTPPRASSRCETASSTPSRFILSRPARSIRSTPHLAKSPTSRCRRAPEPQRHCRKRVQQFPVLSVQCFPPVRRRSAQTQPGANLRPVNGPPAAGR